MLFTYYTTGDVVCIAKKARSVIKLFIFEILLANLSQKLYNTLMDDMRMERRRELRRRQQRAKRIRNRAIIILALVLVLALLVLCIVLIARGAGKDDDAAASNSEQNYTTAKVNSCQITNAQKTAFSLKVGELCMLTLPEGTDARTVIFSSDNPAVVRVDSAGRLDALATGTAKVSAVGPGFSALCDCTVTPAAQKEDTFDGYLTTAYTANADVLARNAETADVGEYLYSITVNRRTNTVTVYTFDQKGNYTVPVRAMVCSCGRDGGYSTPTGEYDIYYRDDWLSLSGDVYGYYISGFYGDFLFHSVPYRTLDHGDLKTEEFNKLGTLASEGCVRMMMSDVMWIYDHCEVGTPVEVIDADESADPLGKPPTVKLEENVKWDPTDPDPQNPYWGKQPAITGVKDATVEVGESFDVMSGVKATDACGKDITDRMVIAGVLLNDKPGVYYLTYTVTDEFRRTVEVTRCIEVQD